MDLDNRKNEAKSDLKQIDIQIEVCNKAWSIIAAILSGWFIAGSTEQESHRDW